MWTIFGFGLRRSRGQILGWGISLALLAIYLIGLYPTVASQREQYRELLKAYPPEMMAFFGGALDLSEPASYLDFTFFTYVPVVLGIYAVLAGSGLLATDEENGILDLILAHPISRTRLYVGRLLTFVASLLGILALTWLGFTVLLPGSPLGVDPGPLVLPFLSVFGVLLLFAALALFLSMILPSRSAAATVSGLVLVASYVVSSLKGVSPGLESVDRWLPLHYYQKAAALNGLDWGQLGVLLGGAALLALAGWALFTRRDIRVGGEAGWRVPGLRRPRPAG
ncbi:MAG: ABC transporter permease subunit [Anaerolineae bacterium]|nr:ABC transporter permease subunit [Anaerolineae bacterium]